jgi:PAS domain-containing protein
MGSTGPRPAASKTAGYVEFDMLPVALAQLDAEFVVTGWNQEAERLFGFGADEVLGRRALDVLNSSRCSTLTSTTVARLWRAAFSTASRTVR